MIFMLSGSTIGTSSVDSARQNLASSFVNGFVNAAFGQDKLLMEDGNKWLYKNKEHGKIICEKNQKVNNLGSIYAPTAGNRAH
jgi:hypothetical protein